LGYRFLKKLRFRVKLQEIRRIATDEHGSNTQQKQKQKPRMEEKAENQAEAFATD
jgi:hypothetical protein